MKGKKVWIVKWFRIVVGVLFMALAVNIVYEPMGMVTGGVAGFSIVIKKISSYWIPGGIPVGVSNFILNIPIFLMAFKVKGKHFVIDTFIANCIYTVAMLKIPIYPIAEKDYVLAVVTGGVLTGIGLGMVFLAQTSTGGTDLLSAIINKKLPQYSIARILLVIDSAVVVCGAVIFGISSAIYACMAVYISSKIMDSILEGGKFAKSIFVISEKYEQIGEKILQDLERGVTIIDAAGMYSGTEYKMLFCVMGKKQLAKFNEIVREIDDKAFVIIGDAREVFGEGFIENC